MYKFNFLLLLTIHSKKKKNHDKKKLLTVPEIAIVFVIFYLHRFEALRKNVSENL